MIGIPVQSETGKDYKPHKILFLPKSKKKKENLKIISIKDNVCHIVIIIIIIFKPIRSGCSEQRCYSKHSTPTSWSRWTRSIFQNRLRAYLGMSFPLGNVTKPGLPNCCSLTWWEICVLWWPWKLYELGLWSLVGSTALARFWVKGQMNCNTWPARLWVVRWVNVLSPHKNILLLKTNAGEVWRPYALWSVKMWGG